MKTLFACAIGQFAVGWALAQAVPMPLAAIGGKPVAAHYVRLEGLGPQITMSELKAAQDSCRKLGKPVDLPPEGSPLSKLTREDYYHATHLIEFTRMQILLITSECVLEWQEQKPKLVVSHPHGVCMLDVKKKVARGHCDGSSRGPMIPLPELRQEILGLDAQKNCIRTATQVGTIRSVQCVERRPEPWRSFLYRAGADRRGLILEEGGSVLPGNLVLRDIKAVEVRKNITVGSDMLDLARTQGYAINPGSRPHP